MVIGLVGDEGPYSPSPSLARIFRSQCVPHYGEKNSPLSLSLAGHSILDGAQMEILSIFPLFYDGTSWVFDDKIEKKNLG